MHARHSDWLEASVGAKLLEQATTVYKWDFGALPATDNRSTWVQKLIDAGYFAPHSYAPIDPQGNVTDPWGTPFILTTDPLNGGPVIRSCGTNKRDDAGQFDDLSSNAPVNFGYYWKSGWPMAMTMAVAVPFGLLVLVAVAVSKPSRRTVIYSAVIPLYLGVSAIFVSFLLRPGLRGPPMPFAGWLMGAGCIAMLFGVFAPLVVREIQETRASRICRLNKCYGCGYSLDGIEGH